MASLENKLQSKLESAVEWYKSHNIFEMDDGAQVEGEHFTHSVIIYRKDGVWYFITKSPQQRARRRNPGSLQGKGQAGDITQAFGNWLLKCKDKELKRIEKIKAKRQLAAAFQNPYKVGDILYSSWGYDQTNREFFQVVKVGPRSLTLREIQQRRSEYGQDFSWRTEGVKDSFVKGSKATTTTIQVYERGGKIQHYVNSPIYGHLYLWDGGAVYASDGH